MSNNKVPIEKVPKITCISMLLDIDNQCLVLLSV